MRFRFATVCSPPDELTTEVHLAASRITKAVIAAAGSGTRFLPATKAIPKEMIPLIDRPIIQYLVEELSASGIEDVVFVSRWDKKVLEDHFDQHPTLEDSLAASGKARYLEETRRPGELVNVAYIRQRGPYGNGTPALNAAPLLGDQPFVYAFGDDLVSSDVPFTRQLIDQYRKTPGVILGAQEVPRSEVPNYGMIEVDDDMRVTKIVEKPEPDAVTSEPRGLRPLHPAARSRSATRRDSNGQGWRTLASGRHRSLHASRRGWFTPVRYGAGAG